MDELRAKVVEVLGRWPSAGLAAGVVRDGSLVWFCGHGVADIDAKTPVTEDTVFRVASLTKTFTAVAVMQLWEQGLVDLDAPANDYLRTFRLVPMRSGLGAATVRHLLTHTAGVGYWRSLSDLLRPGVGSGDVPVPSVPSLADYYRKGLPVEVEPGTKWVYSNHGFAALGQIVEDVSGQALDRYLREHILEPLGMAHTDLVRSDRVRPLLASGYVLRRRGLKPVAADGELPLQPASGLYATTRDLARYVAALVGGGVGEHGSVLKPETLTCMFDPHFQPDPRVPGMGLGFMRGDENGHRTVGHGGIQSGFLSAMSLAPDEGIGVVVLANTGGLDGRGAPEQLSAALLRHLLGLPDQTLGDGPPRPEAWRELCGWYSPNPGPVTNLFTRAVMGAGAEVTVRQGHLLLKPLTPIPSMRRGLRLYPDDAHDAYVFRADFSDVGWLPLRAVFSSATEDRSTVRRLLLEMMSFDKRPDVRNPRPWLTAAIAAGATAFAVRRARRLLRSSRTREASSGTGMPADGGAP